MSQRYLQANIDIIIMYRLTYLIQPINNEMSVHCLSVNQRPY